MAFVIFDLDRTITRFGTYTPFLGRYASRHQPLRLLTLPAVLLGMAAYKARLIRRGQLKSFMLYCLAGPVHKEDFLQHCRNFAQWMIENHCYAAALDCIRRHQQRGDTLLLATASYDFYADAFADLLGIDHVIATQAQWQNDKLQPSIKGENCYGIEKYRRVLAYISQMSRTSSTHETQPQDVFFYTDHHTDIPLLRDCHKAYVVNPTTKLKSWAQHHEHAEILIWT